MFTVQWQTDDLLTDKLAVFDVASRNISATAVLFHWNFKDLFKPICTTCVNVAGCCSQRIERVHNSRVRVRTHTTSFSAFDRI